MNDLHGMLRRATDEPGGPVLLPEELLRAGKKRVARRRVLAVAGGAAAVAVIAAGFAVAGELNGPNRAEVAGPTRDGAGFPAGSIPVEEVERRCTLVLNAAHDTDHTWVAGRDSDGTGVSATRTGETIEAREGHHVELVPEGEAWPVPPEPGHVGSSDPVGFCLIPQADLIDGMEGAWAEPLPRPRDKAAVASLCSRRYGYSFSDWRVAAAGALAATDAGSRPQFIGGFLEAEDGRIADCGLEEGYAESPYFPHLTISDAPTPDASVDALAFHPSAHWFAVASDDSLGPVGRGLLYGVFPGAADTDDSRGQSWSPAVRVEVLADGEVVGSGWTDRSGFAVPFDWPAGAEITARISNPVGEVIWEGPLPLER